MDENNSTVDPEHRIGLRGGEERGVFLHGGVDLFVFFDRQIVAVDVLLRDLVMGIVYAGVRVRVMVRALARRVVNYCGAAYNRNNGIFKKKQLTNGLSKSRRTKYHHTRGGEGKRAHALQVSSLLVFLQRGNPRLTRVSFKALDFAANLRIKNV